MSRARALARNCRAVAMVVEVVVGAAGAEEEEVTAMAAEAAMNFASLSLRK